MNFYVSHWCDMKVAVAIDLKITNQTYPDLDKKRQTFPQYKWHNDRRGDRRTLCYDCVSTVVKNIRLNTIYWIKLPRLKLDRVEFCVKQLEFVVSWWCSNCCVTECLVTWSDDCDKNWEQWLLGPRPRGQLNSTLCCLASSKGWGRHLTAQKSLLILIQHFGHF